MTQRALDRWLASEGFTFCRQRGSHRTYKDAAGHALVVVQHVGGRWGNQYCRGELADIRRTVRRLLATSVAPSRAEQTA